MSGLLYNSGFRLCIIRKNILFFNVTCINETRSTIPLLCSVDKFRIRLFLFSLFLLYKLPVALLLFLVDQREWSGERTRRRRSSSGRVVAHVIPGCAISRATSVTTATWPTSLPIRIDPSFLFSFFTSYSSEKNSNGDVYSKK